MAIEMQMQRELDSDKTVFYTRIDDRIYLEKMGLAIMRDIAHQIAERYVSEHYQEIAALISQDALATLSVAEAAAKVRETLAEKIPDKVVEVVRTEQQVFQRGILGSLKRIL